MVSLLRPARPHSQYVAFVFNWLRSYLQLGEPLFVHQLRWIVLLLSLDLTPVYRLLQWTYSEEEGRPGWNPCDLFRSLLLMTALGIESLADWASLLRCTPLYAVLSGFHPDHVPGATTFHDFYDRLWDYEKREERRARRKRLLKRRKKPNAKLKKGEKLPPRHPQIVSRIADRLMGDRPAGQHSEDILNQLLKECFVLPSAQHGLLGDTQQLILGGDGSIYLSGANPNGRTKCNCREQGIYRCDCPRTYPDPDASWGWDSYRGQYVYGYTAYELTAVGSVYDLPTYLLFAACQRHDSVAGLLALDKYYQLYPEFRVHAFLGDSAHDALPYYLYLQRHHTQPIIDLNARATGRRQLAGEFTLDELGRPVCPKGLTMLFDGACLSRNRLKWVCPLAGRGKHTPECACSTSAYGRTLYTKPDDDPRLHTMPPRGSAQWKELFAKRSGCERSNSRKKVDLKLMHTRIRCKHKRCVQIALAAMVQHLNAWFKEAQNGLGPAAAIYRLVDSLTLPSAAA